ncbi:adenylate/guanylate cyclase domain-containing protein [Shinella sp.]|uniref:adenylate/guanylate cyclase domain-containing protein n=1 Tax=Shinella sp. TaxID=1870904 RepID=UPI002E0DA46D
MGAPRQGFRGESDGRPAASRAFLRRLRLWTGLVLFLYATMHLLNQAFGIRSVEAMDMASLVLFDPWQSAPGRVLLYGSMSVHAALGLRALYRRRHLRLPPVDAVQLILGLAIPAVLFAHAGSIAYLKSVYGARVGFDKIIYALWVANPQIGLPRQLLLILAVWIHGCLGVRAWLRTKQWYARHVPVLMSLATLVPVLAILGFVNAGLDMRALAALGIDYLSPGAYEAPGSVAANATAQASAIADRITLAYLALLGGILVLRLARDWHSSRFSSVKITYPGPRTVSVPVGFSVLEASRWCGIPHASVCGGRGRCSTCRIEIVAGGEALPAAAGDEERLLRRIGAPPSIRLACQIRPQHDLAVVPLVHSATAAQTKGGAFAQVASARRETEVAALFVDLRQSTRLADDRLPYDTFFIVERYIKAVSTAVRESGGHVTNIAGDGVMSVFGADGPTHDAARDAFRAALLLWEGIDALNQDLHQELNEPLRVGIGLHVGVAVVGTEWTGGLEGMPFLGDTGNVAARLEAQTKRLDAIMVASREAILMAAGREQTFEFAPVLLAGKQEPIEVACFRESEELRLLLGAPVAG